MFSTIISLIPMFVCAFWCILLLTKYKNENKAKVFLGFYMFVAFLLYFGHAAYFNHEYKFYVFWESIYVFCSLSVYPLYFIYIRLISKKTSLEWRDFLVLIPSFLMFCFSILLYINMSGSERILFSQNILYEKDISKYLHYSTVLSLEVIKLKLFRIVFFIQLIPVIYYGRKYIIDYNKKIQNYYADTEGKTLQHFKELLYIFIATSLASGAANIIGKSFFTHSAWLLLIPSIIFASLLFIIGYLGYKQDFTLSTFVIEQNADDVRMSRSFENEINNDYYNENIKHRLLEELKSLLEKDQIFKRNDLRITDISTRLNTNRTYVSKVVNEELKTNFCDLINNYRIEFAKKLLTETSNQSLGLSQIGELSGFKSDSSFYRIFKDKEGISPGDFRKRNT